LFLFEKVSKAGTAQPKKATSKIAADCVGTSNPSCPVNSPANIDTVPQRIPTNQRTDPTVITGRPESRTLQERVMIQSTAATAAGMAKP
jgi:hypothetical protein